jgi:hypothetical protein
VIAIEVGEAEGADVSQADAGAVETFSECARTDTGVDKQDAARRPDDRRVSGRAAGEDAEFERHRARNLMKGRAADEHAKMGERMCRYT